MSRWPSASGLSQAIKSGMQQANQLAKSMDLQRAPASAPVSRHLRIEMDHTSRTFSTGIFTTGHVASYTDHLWTLVDTDSGQILATGHNRNRKKAVAQANQALAARTGTT